MVDKEKLAGVFTAQLYDVRTKRDGGGRVTLDFGKDGLEAIQFIQTLASKGDLNFEVAMVVQPPTFPNQPMRDNENGYQEEDNAEPF